MPDREVPLNPPEPVMIEGHEEFEVEKILDKRTHRRQVEYLVKWTGHPACDATWEPLIYLENARDAVSQFELEKCRIMIIRCFKCG